jgi:putative flippase GtrA
MKLKAPKWLRAQVSGLARLPRFAVTGGLATLVHWLAMASLVIAGSSAWLATSLGMVLGALVSYLLHREFVFLSTLAHRCLLGKYVLSFAASWLANLAVFALLQEGGLRIAAAPWPIRRAWRRRAKRIVTVIRTSR